MKKLINKFLALSTALALFAACEEEAVLTVLEEVQFPAALVASTDAVVLTADHAETPVLTLSWPEVGYPVQAPVTYTLQFALPADTIGANAWANATKVVAGSDVLSKAFLGAALNELAIGLGLTPDEEGSLLMRVQSYLDRAVYSAPVAVKVTPYEPAANNPALWVAGDFQGWNVTTAPTLVSVNSDGVYEGYIYIPAGGTFEFKLYAQPDWSPTSYGDGGDGALIEANYAGANFRVPSEGYYLFAVNLNTMTYLLMKTSWGLIGGATPGGWSTDTPLIYHPATQTWSVTTELKADGTFKFRANNAWTLDFGLDQAGNLAYANYPWRDYVDQPQFTVPTDGNYTITLDLHQAGNYTYKIIKN